jgi:general secretion pathway protein B
VAVLDAGTRSGLPAMKLSMHVFNSDPARRFAIIDGQRVTEGSRLGSATVVEIRRDGVVLEVGGTRVLLPRP